jgi:hypothetical protein
MTMDEPTLPQEDIENPGGEPQEPIDAEPAQVNNSFVGQLNARSDAVVNNSLTLAAAAGQDMQMFNSLVGGPTAVGRDLTMEQSVAVTVVAGNGAIVRDGNVGVLITKGAVTLEGQSKVLLNTRQAIAFGAALGVVFGLMQLLFGRRKCG